MKHLRLFAWLTVLLVLLGAGAGCADTGGESPSAAAPVEEEGSSEGEEVVSFLDSMGRQVELAGPVERMIALGPADCEIIAELGAADKLVGRGDYCDYPEEITALPAVQSGADLNLEQILALEPDLVFMMEMSHTHEQREAIENAGIPVFMTEAAGLEGVYATITRIGAVLDKNSEASALVEEMKATFDRVAGLAAAKGENPSVYFEISPLEYGLWTAGGGTFMDEIAGILQMENVFSDVSEWGEVSQEQVLERNPEFIVTVAMYTGQGPTPEEEILGRNGWQSVAAVEKDQVLRVDNDQFTRPGPRLAQAAEILYSLVYERAA